VSGDVIGHVTILFPIGHLLICFSFFFWLRVLDKAEYSDF